MGIKTGGYYIRNYKFKQMGIDLFANRQDPHTVIQLNNFHGGVNQQVRGGAYKYY